MHHSPFRLKVAKSPIHGNWNLLTISKWLTNQCRKLISSSYWWKPRMINMPPKRLASVFLFLEKTLIQCMWMKLVLCFLSRIYFLGGTTGTLIIYFGRWSIFLLFCLLRWCFMKEQNNLMVFGLKVMKHTLPSGGKRTFSIMIIKLALENLHSHFIRMEKLFLLQRYTDGWKYPLVCRCVGWK